MRGKLDSSGLGWDPQRDVVYPGLKLRVLQRATCFLIGRATVSLTRRYFYNEVCSLTALRIAYTISCNENEISCVKCTPVSADRKIIHCLYSNVIILPVGSYGPTADKRQIALHVASMNCTDYNAAKLKQV